MKRPLAILALLAALVLAATAAAGGKTVQTTLGGQVHRGQQARLTTAR